MATISVSDNRGTHAGNVAGATEGRNWHRRLTNTLANTANAQDTPGLVPPKRREAPEPPLHESGVHKAIKRSRQAPIAARQKSGDSAPLIRKKFVREDTGTHETLTILDDSIVDSGEETGIDPYNTGEFDRSKNWEKHLRS